MNPPEILKDLLFKDMEFVRCTLTAIDQTGFKLMVHGKDAKECLEKFNGALHKEYYDQEIEIIYRYKRASKEKKVLQDRIRIYSVMKFEKNHNNVLTNKSIEKIFNNFESAENYIESIKFSLKPGQLDHIYFIEEFEVNF